MAGGGEPVPALRASDDERERAAELLRDVATSGRLTVDELDDRLQRVFAAALRTDLEALVGDVVVPDGDAHRLSGSFAPLRADGAARVLVRPGENGTRRVVSILGGSDRKGGWRLAARCTVLNVLGGSDLDLTHVELAGDRVELRVISVLGGADILVPEHMNVEVSEAAILGGNDVDVGAWRPDPGGPVVHLRLISILGGSDVHRGPRPGLRERMAQRRLERDRDRS